MGIYNQLMYLQDKHGLEKIEVKDDGCGIDKSDVTVMCLSSHTSKITNFSDLGEILNVCSH